MKLSLLQKILSYIYPVKVATAPGKTTPLLGLYHFRGRWQLSAATALYSDGAAYRPMTTAFTYLRKELPHKQKMLVLGAGLGSAVAVLQHRNINIPEVTLVDIDPQVISWGKEMSVPGTGKSHEWICADVQQFARDTGSRYDLIVLDIFQDRIVPHFVTRAPFLKHCRQLLLPGNSVLVLNYIINNEQNWEEAREQINTLFLIEKIIAIGINRIMILRNNA